MYAFRKAQAIFKCVISNPTLSSFFFFTILLDILFGVGYLQRDRFWHL